MIFIQEVAAYLVAAGLGLKTTNPGQNMWLGKKPTSPDVATMLFEYGGAPGNTGFGKLGLADEMPGLQVICRGIADDYLEPRTRIEKIYQRLPQIQGIVVGGTKYRMVRAQQSPFLFNRDEQTNRVEFAVNFLCEKELSVVA